MAQYAVPCSVYRGGTSRGVFFHRKDLPNDDQSIRQIFLNCIDAYNPSQIDGLGSGTSHTSKVVVIEPAVNKKNVDINYTFFQIGIGEEIIDDKGTCGNLMAAVGTFAIEEGLVVPQGTSTTVRAYNTNIRKRIDIEVPLKKGKPSVQGSFYMPGVVRSGSRYQVNLLNPGGGKTGKTLPLGARSFVDLNGEKIETTFVDIVNPFVYLGADSLEVTGIEDNKIWSSNELLLKRLECIRRQMAVLAGMEQSEEGAKASPAIPKIGVVAKPQTYVTSSGKKVYKEEVDIIAKMLSMGKVHRTFAGSGLYSLAAATLLKDTLPNQYSTISNSNDEENIVRIGHPDGVAEVRVGKKESKIDDVEYVGLDRTARLIMKGYAYIPS